MRKEHPAGIIKEEKPYYTTALGGFYLGDATKLLKKLPTESVNLILTSPPYAIHEKKKYKKIGQEEYVDWFMNFADDFWRVLKKDGSLVIDIGGGRKKGQPIRSTYQFELLLTLCKKFYLAQEFYWYNPAKLPTPAEWVTIRRIRVKDAVNFVWWFSKCPYPKADNRGVLQPYSKDMEYLLEKGYKPKERPSGHKISNKFCKRNSGSIPPNLLIIPNTVSRSQYLKRCGEAKINPHPARFPSELPEFFVKFLTEEGDLVLDPFAGSNVTGEVCEKKNRRWLSFEIEEEFVIGSKFRFDNVLDGQGPRELDNF